MCVICRMRPTITSNTLKGPDVKVVKAAKSSLKALSHGRVFAAAREDRLSDALNGAKLAAAAIDTAARLIDTVTQLLPPGLVLSRGPDPQP